MRQYPGSAGSRDTGDAHRLRPAAPNVRPWRLMAGIPRTRPRVGGERGRISVRQHEALQLLESVQDEDDLLDDVIVGTQGAHRLTVLQETVTTAASLTATRSA